MTAKLIHDFAEKWLPIPRPDYKDCPPTVQATLRDPRVLGAQQFFKMQVEQQLEQTEMRRQMMAKMKHKQRKHRR